MDQFFLTKKLVPFIEHMLSGFKQSFEKREVKGLSAFDKYLVDYFWGQDAQKNMPLLVTANIKKVNGNGSTVLYQGLESMQIQKEFLELLHLQYKKYGLIDFAAAYFPREDSSNAEQVRKNILKLAFQFDGNVQKLYLPLVKTVNTKQKERLERLLVRAFGPEESKKIKKKVFVETEAIQTYSEGTYVAQFTSEFKDEMDFAFKAEAEKSGKKTLCSFDAVNLQEDVFIDNGKDRPLEIAGVTGDEQAYTLEEAEVAVAESTDEGALVPLKTADGMVILVAFRQLRTVKTTETKKDQKPFFIENLMNGEEMPAEETAEEEVADADSQLPESVFDRISERSKRPKVGKSPLPAKTKLPLNLAKTSPARVHKEAQAPLPRFTGENETGKGQMHAKAGPPVRQAGQLGPRPTASRKNSRPKRITTQQLAQNQTLPPQQQNSFEFTPPEEEKKSRLGFMGKAFIGVGAPVASIGGVAFGMTTLSNSSLESASNAIPGLAYKVGNLIADVFSFFI